MSGARVLWCQGLWVWLGWCILWQWITTVAGQNQCTLDNGKCFYQIQLSSTCENDASLQTNRLQNDYNEKVNEIQKSLTHVSTDHSKRIADLENKLSNIVSGKLGGGGGGGGPYIDLYYTNKNHHKVRHGKGKFSENGGRKENELLNMLHEQFSVLRRDIAVSKRKIREQERILRDTRLKLNKTEEALLDTTKKLINTEKDLADSKAENWRLRQEIEDRDIELNKTKEKLLETIRKLRATELELLDVRDENRELKKKLQDVNFMLEATRKLLANALRKYHELNLRHEVTVIELFNKTEELVSCFKAKTSQFCGFEDSEICGFQGSETALSWARHKMATPSGWTGPSADHTCGNKNGYYLYVPGKSAGHGQMARIMSPKYNGIEEQCVEFFYHMWGRNIGTLNVYTRVSEEEFIPAWRAFGNQGNVWIKARMPIPQDVARKGYRVVFESILENGLEGDIAIDDFRVFDGKCYHVRTAQEARKEAQALRERGSPNNTTTNPLEFPPLGPGGN